MSASEIRSLQPAADNEHASRLAFLAVLRRYETGQDTAAESLESLRMLGLVEDTAVPDTRMQSAKNMARSRRRKAARERARNEQDGAA